MNVLPTNTFLGWLRNIQAKHITEIRSLMGIFGFEEGRVILPRVLGLNEDNIFAKTLA